MSRFGLRHPATLAVSALVGLAVSLLLLYLVKRGAAVDTRPVVIARAAIPAGAALDAEVLGVVDWPSHLMPAAALGATDTLLGRITRVPMYPGEPVLAAKLWEAGERGDLEDQLSGSERALSVPVNEMVGVDADSLPGSFVDLIVTPKTEPGAGSTLAVAERLRVLAVNRSTDSRRPAAIRQLTLAVTSEQARAIEAARQRGALTALLRNSRDMPQPAARVVSTPEPTPEPTPVGAARPASRDIEIILGTQTLSTQEPGGAAEVRR